MATITHICTLDHVATILTEDLDLLEAIVANDDNLTYARSSSSIPARMQPSPP